jgi:hypothetical protein
VGLRGLVWELSVGWMRVLLFVGVGVVGVVVVLLRRRGITRQLCHASIHTLPIPIKKIIMSKSAKAQIQTMPIGLITRSPLAFVLCLGFAYPNFLGRVTYSLLRQLPRPLILAVPNQLNDSPLIRREASDFLDDLTDKRCALGEVAFSTGDARSRGYGCDFLLRY